MVSISDFVVFGVVPALAVVLALLWVIVPRASRIERPWSRRIVGCTLSAGVLGVLSLAWISFAEMEQGSWLCTVCGRMEDQRRYFGAVVSNRPERASGDYARWFERAVPLEHEHDWTPVGCHLSASGAAYMSNNPKEVKRFHATLPLVPDEDLARELVWSFARADPERRRIMLEDFDRGWESGPFAALVEGSPSSSESFRSAHAQWLAEHPLWR